MAAFGRVLVFGASSLALLVVSAVSAPIDVDGVTQASSADGVPLFDVGAAGEVIVRNGGLATTSGTGSAVVLVNGTSGKLEMSISGGGSVSTSGDGSFAIDAGVFDQGIFNLVVTGDGITPVLTTSGDGATGIRLGDGTGSASTAVFNVLDAQTAGAGAGLSSSGAHSPLILVDLLGASSVSATIENSILATGGSMSDVVNIDVGSGSDTLVFILNSTLRTSGSDTGLIGLVTGDSSIRNVVIIDSTFLATGAGSGGIGLLSNAGEMSSDTTFISGTTITTPGIGLYIQTGGHTSSRTVNIVYSAISTGEANAGALFIGGLGQGSALDTSFASLDVSTVGANSDGIRIGQTSSESAQNASLSDVTVTTQGDNSKGIVLEGQTGPNSVFSFDLTNVSVTAAGVGSTGFEVTTLPVDDSTWVGTIDTLSVTTSGANANGLVIGTSDVATSSGGAFDTHSVMILDDIVVATTGANSHGIVLGKGLGTNLLTTTSTLSLANIAVTTSGGGSHALVIGEDTTLSLAGQNHAGATTANGTIVNGTIDSFDGLVASGAGSRAVMNSGILYGTFTVDALVVGNLGNNGLIESAAGPGGVAVQFTGTTDDIFELQPMGVVLGEVLAGLGTDTFILGGEGAASFARALLGTQYNDFEAFRKEGTSAWTLTGMNDLMWTVAGGEFILAGDTVPIGETPFLVTGPARVTVAATGSITATSAASPAVRLQHADASVLVKGSILASASDGIVGEAGGTVIVGSGGSLTGSLTGATFSGGRASMTVAGTVVGDGGTAVQFAGFDDRFELNAGFDITGTVDAAGGTDTFVLGGPGTASFDVALIDTQYNGFDAFEKTGSSTWTLTGVNTVAGPFLVNEGTLVQNAALENVLMTVNSGGTLGGIGTVGGLTLNSGGTLAPGNSIGTLNVAGNAAFNAGSTYVVEINAPGNAPGVNNDLVVADTATINSGAIFHVVPENRTDTGLGYAPNTQYTIIETAGVGDLTVIAPPTITDSFAFLSFTGHDDGQNYYLTSSAAAASFCLPGASFNQCSTGEAVRDLGSGHIAFDAVVGMSEAGANAAFNALSGEVHASGQHVIEQTFALFSGALGDKGIGGSAGGGQALTAPLGYAAAPRSGPGVVAIDDATGNPGASYPRQLWLMPLGGRGVIEADGNAGKLDWSTAGLAGGYEMTLDVTQGEAFVGIALGYIRSHGAVPNRLSRLDVDGFYAGIYGGWSEGPVSLTGSLATASNHISTERRIVFGGIDETARATYWGQSVGFSGEAAYAFDLGGGTTVSPLFTLDAGWSGHGGFGETGAGALNLTAAAENWARFDTGIGVALQQVILTEHGEVMLDGRLVWEHAFTDQVPSQSLAFAGSSTPFEVRGPAAGRDRLRLGLGVSLEATDDITVRASYTGLFSSSQSSHGVAVGFNVKF